MGRRSGVGSSSVLKLSYRIAKHPWIASKLAKLQVEKWLFNQIASPSTKDGMARQVRQVSIRITDICNLRCIMCGQWGPTGFLHGKDLRELKREEVSPARYIECLEDLVAHGHHPIVYLWGGEPTMYDGWLDVLQACKRLKLPTAIATNGTRLAQHAQAIVDSRMFLLQISIDGPDKEIHNRIRRGVGSADSYTAIQDGIAAVREARSRSGSDLPLIASLTTVSKENYQHLTGIYEAYKDKVDLFVFYPAWWIDEESADAHAKDFQRRFGFEPTLHRGWVGGWKPSDYAELDAQLQQLKELGKQPGSPPVILIPDISGVDNLHSYYTDHKATFGFDQCISICQVVEIDSNGDISPCRDYHDYVVGNIKDHTITELWNSERFRIFRKSLAQDGLMPVCTRCCGLMGY
ncbi:MAG: radical SAM protein [Desulfovibrio sp.]|nr:radical SAM protein [Desulfovibrio sp.]MCA1985550.1 radical SAM protein [Desulfovibrio sp.]